MLPRWSVFEPLHSVEKLRLSIGLLSAKRYFSTPQETIELISTISECNDPVWPTAQQGLCCRPNNRKSTHLRIANFWGLRNMLRYLRSKTMWYCNLLRYYATSCYTYYAKIAMASHSLQLRFAKSSSSAACIILTKRLRMSHSSCNTTDPHACRPFWRQNCFWRNWDCYRLWCVVVVCLQESVSPTTLHLWCQETTDFTERAGIPEEEN